VLSTESTDYEFFRDELKKLEMVQICSEIADYMNNNGINNLMLVDRSARLAYIGIREAWKRKYKDKPIPNIYFVNPTGFIGFEEAEKIDKESKIYEENIDNDRGRFYNAHLEEFIQTDFEKSYKKLSADKDQPLLLFDNCIHSGGAIKPVIKKLQEMKFTKVRVGVAEDSENTSGINPDFAVYRHNKLHSSKRCHIFGEDRIVDRKFGSVKSIPTKDTQKIEMSTRLRREMVQIFQETPAELFDITNTYSVPTN
jgi:hypothetical protein